METFNNLDEYFVTTFTSLGDFFMRDIQMRYSNIKMFLMDTEVHQSYAPPRSQVVDWFRPSNDELHLIPLFVGYPQDERKTTNLYSTIRFTLRDVNSFFFFFFQKEKCTCFTYNEN